VTCNITAMINGGRLWRLMRLFKGFLTVLATLLALRISWNSGSTVSTPRIFFSTAFPSSSKPLSIRLLGVSCTSRDPIVSISAGTPAKANDILHPYPPLILHFPVKYINQSLRLQIKISNKDHWSYCAVK